MSTNPSTDHMLDQEDRRIPLTLLVLAFPIIASMVSRTVMNLIDFVMVTQLGTEAQAAVMPAGMVLFTILACAMGLFSSVSTYVSQSLGRNQLADCTAYAWQGVYLSILGGIILLPCWWLMPPLFAWAGHDPIVQAMEVDYAQIGVLGFGPAMATFALTNFFNGIHKPMVAFVAAIIGNIFNIFANYALIFGHWGFEPMGMAGAAWATQIAGLIQALVMLGWMLMPYYRKHYHSLQTWRVDFKRIGRILWLGAPAGLHFMSDISAWTIFTLVLVGSFGTVQLAAHNITFKFLELSFMPAVGLGVAVTAAVGKAIGAKRPDRARRITRWALLYSMCYMGLIGLGYVAIHVLVRVYGPEPFGSFITRDPDVILWTSRLLLCCAVFQVFDALAITHMSALRGAGDNHVPAIVSIIMTFTIFLGGSFVVAHLFPAWETQGPWWVATFFVCTIGTFFWARWKWGPWEMIDLHKDGQQLPGEDIPEADPAVAAAESTPLP